MVITWRYTFVVLANERCFGVAVNIFPLVHLRSIIVIGFWVGVGQTGSVRVMLKNWLCTVIAVEVIAEAIHEAPKETKPWSLLNCESWCSLLTPWCLSCCNIGSLTWWCMSRRECSLDELVHAVYPNFYWSPWRCDLGWRTAK